LTMKFESCDRRCAMRVHVLEVSLGSLRDLVVARRRQTARLSGGCCRMVIEVAVMPGATPPAWSCWPPEVEVDRHSIRRPRPASANGGQAGHRRDLHKCVDLFMWCLSFFPVVPVPTNSVAFLLRVERGRLACAARFRGHRPSGAAMPSRRRTAPWIPAGKTSDDDDEPTPVGRDRHAGAGGAVQGPLALGHVGSGSSAGKTEEQGPQTARPGCCEAAQDGTAVS